MPVPARAAMAASPAANPARGDALAALGLAVLIGAMVAGRLETAATCVLAAAVLHAAAGARPPAAAWWRAVAIAVAAALLLNLFLTPGPTWWEVRPLGLRATLAGLVNGAVLALRLLGASLALQVLATRWPGENAADELAWRLAPLERVGVPVRVVRETVGLALRFVPLLADEARRVARLQDARAGRPPRGPLEWWSRRRAIAVPTLVNALERAERVSLALDARHWRLRPLPAPRPEGWTARLLGVAIVAVAVLWRA